MLDATERKALTFSVFTAACICFAPAEFISGGVLLLASVGLYLWDARVTRREAEGAPAAPPAGGASGDAAVAGAGPEA